MVSLVFSETSFFGATLFYNRDIEQRPIEFQRNVKASVDQEKDYPSIQTELKITFEV